MTLYELKTAGRQYRRQFDTAIRRNLVRALTELVTNSDDSYRRLEAIGIKVSGRIHVVLDRASRTISVIDDGEGLTKEDMVAKFTEYGGATSGLKENRSVRGYFGKGIKDVLFGMDKGRVKSIQDGQLYSASFMWGKSGKPQVKINRPQRATREIRRALNIKENGTRVEFEIPEDTSVSRHETLLKSLANFYMLRTINTRDDREVGLTTINSNGTR